MWNVYIVKCKDEKLYTGITNDVERRVSEHNAGKGGYFTRGRTPVKIVYLEDQPNRSKALKREAAIKKLNRESKLTLIKRYKKTK